MSIVGLGERLRIIAVTATVTSAAWVLFGFGYLFRDEGQAIIAKPTLAPPDPAETVAAGAGAGSPMILAPATTARPQPVNAGGWIIPVSGVTPDQLVDTFTASRSGGRVHDAIDIMAPRGTPVLAAVPGTVEKFFNSKLGGLTVYVRSPDRRLITYYAHLDRYQPGLAEKQTVRQGQVLGYVGSTGSATPEAPHLHFEIMPVAADKGWWQTEKPLNPYPVLAAKTR